MTKRVLRAFSTCHILRTSFRRLDKWVAWLSELPLEPRAIPAAARHIACLREEIVFRSVCPDRIGSGIIVEVG